MQNKGYYSVQGHSRSSPQTSQKLSLLDKNVGTSARFYVYITEKSHTENVMYTVSGKKGAT